MANGRIIPLSRIHILNVLVQLPPPLILHGVRLCAEHIIKNARRFHTLCPCRHTFDLSIFRDNSDAFRRNRRDDLRTMRRDNELNLRENPPQIRQNALLPRGMEEQIDLIDHHNALRLLAGFLAESGVKARTPIGDVGNERERGLYTITSPRYRYGNRGIIPSTPINKRHFIILRVVMRSPQFPQLGFRGLQNHFYGAFNRLVLRRRRTPKRSLLLRRIIPTQICPLHPVLDLSVN